ncbi:hypothetical protein [Streptomyces sp. NBC_00842]|uniref:hypothetical protein n=1 Tax=Streptomyces sp. NBC_00842 TaxID=2975848 RepID=UPI0038685850|nr:hypothetical protein OH821_35845 [Streptomyces sp. NBC_00842]
MPLGHGPRHGHFRLTRQQQLDVVFEVTDGGQRGSLVRRLRYVRVPRGGLDLHPYDGEARRPQFGRTEQGGGPPLGEGAAPGLGQHGLVGHGTAVQDDAGELQPGPARPVFQACTRIHGACLGAEAHRQVRLELSRELCFHRPHPSRSVLSIPAGETSKGY